MTLRSQPSAGSRQIRTALLSLQGKRASNQDRILLCPFNSPPDSVVAAVADGLGGMQDGDKAAEIAVETVKEAASELSRCMTLKFNDVSDLLTDIYERANNRILDYSRASDKAGAVGTTLTTLVLSDSRYLIAHLGDSRCYRINLSGVQQVTRDHTLADELVRQGTLDEREYNASPFRNQLTRSLGAKQFCEADIVPELEFGHPEGDCTFLLCSDGFYSRLENTDLSRLGVPSPALQDVLESLAAEALRRLTTDNLSAIAIQCSKT
jgi:PPM family protein phosphatase